MATTIPQQHLPTSNTVDITSQIIVGTKNQFGIFWERVDNFLGIARGDNNICQCFYRCSSIHITHHLIARMFFFVFFEVFSLTRVSQ